jgi:hypothetical protein
VDRFDGLTGTHDSTANGLADERAYDVTADEAGNVWIGTFNGLSKFDGSKGWKRLLPTVMTCGLVIITTMGLAVTMAQTGHTIKAINLPD